MTLENEYIKKIVQESQPLFEMAHVEPEDTGLPVMVYVSPKQASHGPRIKFMNDYGITYDYKNSVPMTISDNPIIPISFKQKIKSKDIQLIKNWVVLNRDVLLAYWNHEITTKKMINSIKKVES